MQTRKLIGAAAATSTQTDANQETNKEKLSSKISSRTIQQTNRVCKATNMLQTFKYKNGRTHAVLAIAQSI